MLAKGKLDIAPESVLGRFDQVVHDRVCVKLTPQLALQDQLWPNAHILAEEGL